MRLNVGSGSYAFRCLFEDFDPLTGPTVTVGGHGRGSPAILPVTKFVENNWLGGKRIGGGSFDAIAGSLTGPHGLLGFFIPHFRPVILNPTTGAVVKS